MYHSARWGSWNFQLFSRNDTEHSLSFACRKISTEKGGNGRFRVDKEVTQCPKDGSHALVLGGWQEGRGGAIGPRYTNTKLNNSYFVEGIREELDSANEWFFVS